MLKKNIKLNFLFTVLSTISTFALLKVIYDYFEQDSNNYGLWLAVYSFLSYIYLMDFGLSNGLRNLVTPLINNNKNLMNRYISNNLILMFTICCILAIIFNLIILLINPKVFSELKGFKINNNDFKTFLYIIINLQIIYFGLTFFKSLFHAFAKSYYVNLSQLISNILIIIILVICMNIDIYGNWNIMAIVFVGSQIFVLILFGLLLFHRQKLKWIIRFDRKILSELFSLSNKFLFLQLANLILFNSLPIIIGIYISLENVTNYQLSYKVLSIFLIVTSIVVSPIWTAILEANSKKNIEGIKKITKKLFVFIILLSIICICSSFMLNKILEIWMGKDFKISLIICLEISLFVVISMYCSVFQGILNGLNLFNIQIVSYLIGSIFLVLISWVFNYYNILTLETLLIIAIFSLLIPVICMIRTFFKYIEGY